MVAPYRGRINNSPTSKLYQCVECKTWQLFPEVRIPTAHRCDHCLEDYRVTEEKIAALKVNLKRRIADRAKRVRLLESRNHAPREHAPSADNVTSASDVISICSSEETIIVSIFIE